jgi:hypothetical protein
MRTLNGQRPLRPAVVDGSNEGIYTDALWDCIQCCWHADASARPLINDIRSAVHDFRCQQHLFSLPVKFVSDRPRAVCTRRFSWFSDDTHRKMATHLLAHHDIRPTLATPPPTGPPIPIITCMWNGCGVTASTISSAIERVARDDTWELRSHERLSWLPSGHPWLPCSLNSQTLSHGEYAGQLSLDVIMLLRVIRMALLVYLSSVTLLRWSRMSVTS